MRAYSGVAALVVALAVVAGGAGSAAGRGASPAVEISPHRAFYVLDLGRTRQGSNITAATGAMFMEWAKSCAGWTVKQELTLDLTDTEGNTIRTGSKFSSFESLDGLVYHFTNRDTRNKVVTEDLKGSARLSVKGGAGTADFDLPKGTRFDLPKGTLFPTAHMEALIAAARRGEHVVYRIMFDGASLDGPLAVNAVLGKEEPRPTGAAAREPLTDRPSWRMRLAFFPLKDSRPEPDYELGFRGYDNGVSDDYEIDYGTFSVTAKLKRIEALAKPKC